MFRGFFLRTLRENPLFFVLKSTMSPMMMYMRMVSDMAVNYLKPTVRGYRNGDVNYRYIRIDKAAEIGGLYETYGKCAWDEQDGEQGFCESG